MLATMPERDRRTLASTRMRTPTWTFATSRLNGAKEIYKARYWDAIGGDQIAAQSPALAKVAFDTAVNSGPGKARELLAASGGDPNKFLDLRQAFLTGLVENNPDEFGPYQKAWNNRIAGLRADIGGEQPQMVNPQQFAGMPARANYAPQALPDWADYRDEETPAAGQVATNNATGATTIAPAKVPDNAAAQAYIQAQNQVAQQAVNAIDGQIAQVEQAGLRAVQSGDAATAQRAQAALQQLQLQRAQAAQNGAQSFAGNRVLVRSDKGVSIVDPNEKETKDPEAIRKLNAVGIDSDTIKAAFSNPSHPLHDTVTMWFWAKDCLTKRGALWAAGAVLIGPDENRFSIIVQTLIMQAWTKSQTALGDVLRSAIHRRFRTLAVARRPARLSRKRSCGLKYYAEHPEELTNAPERNILNNRYDVAAERARSNKVGGIVGANEVYGATAANAINIAVQASRDVPRTDFVPFNKLQQMWQTNTGNPEQMRFAAATEYAGQRICQSDLGRWRGDRR